MEETASLDYTTATADALLAALEQAGRTPDRALLEACLARRDDLVPGLMEWLAIGNEQGDAEEWDDEDPRWYRDIHAGLLFIAFREEKALPLFADLFRDEDREHLRDWFGVPFRNYGPLAVDMLIDLLKDRKAPVGPRLGASEKLKDIALMHPETRDRIVEALRTRLPRVDDDGNFVIPPFDTDDQVELWSFVACALAELKDTASQAQGKALYKADMIDEMLMGDVNDYLAIFDQDPYIREPFDLIEKYHPSPEAIARQEAAFEKLEAEIDAPFLNLSADELVHELAAAGYVPEPGLIRACLKRQSAITPGLLNLLAQYGDPAWGEDDPRWYGPIHAGRLVIAFGEERALPLFEKMLRAEEVDLALDAFQDELAYLGPAAIPMLTRLFQDETVHHFVSSICPYIMKNIAQLHPEAKPQVVEILRAALPPLSERGDPDVPGEVSSEKMSLWASVADALARLDDTASQAQIEALHDWDLIDESLYGGYDEYLKMLNEHTDLGVPPPEYDVAFFYLDHYMAHQSSPEALLPFDEPFEEPEALLEDDDTSYPIGYGSQPTFVREAIKVGRNDPCPCGSGKKYKKCCARR